MLTLRNWGSITAWFRCCLGVSLLALSLAGRARAQSMPVSAESVPSSTAKGVASPECAGGLIYVGPVRSIPSDDALASLLEFRIAEGVRYSIENNAARVVSAAELAVHGAATANSMRTLHSWLRVPVEGAFQRVLGGRPPPMSAYIQPTLIQSEGALVVELDLYCMDSKVQGSAATINAKKAVRGNSKGRAQLLEQVFAAASRLLGKRTAPPEIRIVGGTEQRAPLGKAFALDGSPTVDPDADAIVFQWRGPEGIDFQQEGAQIRFTPTVPGKYKFTLKVSKLLDAKASRERDVEVVVMAPPEVRVEENALLEMRGRTPVTLRGECDACEQWQWTQLSGPVTTVPAECSGTGSAAVCKVWAEAPGLYSFSLSGSNAIGRDSKEGTFGVAPVPVALIDIPTNAVVNHSYDFTGTASHDVFGGSLRFHWEVSKTPFPKVGCAPRYLAAEESVPSAPAGVWLSAPTEATTEFVATQPVDYHVRLTVQAERKFGSRSSSTQQCTSRRISVERPVWWPSIQAGGDFASHDGWSQPWEGFRLKVALNVHPTWLPDWLGLRFAQTIARKDQSSDRFKYLGGTWVGLTAMPSAVFQPYLSSYVRTWEDFALGLEAGIEFRVQRLLVFGASARMEHRSDGWRFPVLGAYMGAGYDL